MTSHLCRLGRAISKKKARAYYSLNSSLDLSPESEPAQELQSRAASSVEAHHRVNGPDTGSNSGGRQVIKKVYLDIFFQ